MPWGFPSPTLSSQTCSRPGPLEGHTECLLPLEPNTSPCPTQTPRTAAALAFPHPQSHGPRPAHLQRTASLFHFCKVGVGATDRVAEGLPVPWFWEVPGSSLPHPLQFLYRETQGVILGSPGRPPARSRVKTIVGGSPDDTHGHAHTHTFPPPKPLPLAPLEEERLGEKGKAGVSGPLVRGGRACEA